MHDAVIGSEGGTFKPHPFLPKPILLVTTADLVADVTAKLGGATGLGGIDAVALASMAL